MRHKINHQYLFKFYFHLEKSNFLYIPIFTNNISIPKFNKYINSVKTAFGSEQAESSIPQHSLFLQNFPREVPTRLRRSPVGSLEKVPEYISQSAKCQILALGIWRPSVYKRVVNHVIKLTGDSTSGYHFGNM